MELAYLWLALLTLAVGVVGLVTFRSIKSLELYVLSVYAELIRRRERDAVFVDFLASALASKGLVSPSELGVIKAVAAPGVLTEEDLDRVDEILDKDPTQLTPQDLLDMKRVAYKLLGRMDQRSIRLGMKLLRYARRIEEALYARLTPTAAGADRVEMSYEQETCTVVIYLHKGSLKERTEGPDLECVLSRAAILKALARRREMIEAENAREALEFYRRCRESNAAGCRALRESLTGLERKSLDILLDRLPR